MEIEYTAAHVAELERQIAELKVKKSQLTNEKLTWERNLTELKASRNAKDKQLKAEVKNRLSEVNQKIIELNIKISAKATLKTDVQQGIKDGKLQLKPFAAATPVEDSRIRLELIQLKNKYEQFSADHTRIASKRLMAADFAIEIDKILKNKR